MSYEVLAILFIVWALYEWWHWYRHLPPQPVIAVSIAIIAGLYSYTKIRQIKKRLGYLSLGRDGERIVGQALEKLRREGYAVFHDIVGKDFNVDHVVVSTHGIFAIETKTYSKPAHTKAKVVSDGQRIVLSGRQPDHKPIQQAIANADWLCGDVLQASTGRVFPVTPVVVFPGWWVDETNNRDIWVLNPDQLS